MWLFRFITCEELNHVMSTLGERLSRSDLYFMTIIKDKIKIMIIIMIDNLSRKNVHVGEPRSATAQIYLPVLILQLFYI